MFYIKLSMAQALQNFAAFCVDLTFLKICLDEFEYFCCFFWIMQIGAVYTWSYVYPVMRIYANKATKDIDMDGSTTRDNTSGETSYLHSEIGTEPLLPSEGYPRSEESMDQVEDPPNGTEGKAKVSSSMLWFPFYNVQKLSYLKV